MRVRSEDSIGLHGTTSFDAERPVRSQASDDSPLPGDPSWPSRTPRHRKGARSPLGRRETTDRSPLVLNLAVTFLVIALIAFVFGFGMLGATAIGFAKILFFVFLVMAVLSFFRGRGSRV